jgi:hypothetical protein
MLPGFDVPVHHSDGMDVDQRSGDRRADPGGFGGRKSRAADALRQRHTLD